MDDGLASEAVPLQVRQRRTDPRGVIELVAMAICLLNGFMGQIYDRIPVIVSPIDDPIWLGEIERGDSLADLLIPCLSELLTGFEVSRMVNRLGLDTPEILKSVA